MVKPDSQDLYESDYYAWVNRQLELLRSGQWHAADIQNLVEEVEDMGKQIKRELETRLTVLLMHLLKWQYQPDRRGANWEITIKGQRRDLEKLLAKNPSLKSINLMRLLPTPMPMPLITPILRQAILRKISRPTAFGLLTTL